MTNERFDDSDTPEERTIPSNVTTQDLDQAISLMQALREEYEQLKKIASDKNAEYEKAEGYVLALLKTAGKSKYHVQGLGTVSIRNRYVVRTPKGITEKVAFFNFVEERHGRDTLLGLQTINHQTLNSFVNAEKEANPLGDIPGIEAPTHEEIIAFRTGK